MRIRKTDGAQAALDKTIAYMIDRQAFGRHLTDFQALQFKLADMATELEAARTLLWRAAAALDAEDPETTKLCAMAKRFATDAGFKVANDALQLRGGYGYLAEYGIEKIVVDLRVHQILEGTNEIMRLIVSRKLISAGRPGDCLTESLSSFLCLADFRAVLASHGRAKFPVAPGRAGVMRAGATKKVGALLRSPAGSIRVRPRARRAGCRRASP